MTRALAAALCLAAVPALAFEGVDRDEDDRHRSARWTSAPGGPPTSMSGTGVIS